MSFMVSSTIDEKTYKYFQDKMQIFFTTLGILLRQAGACLSQSKIVCILARDLSTVWTRAF